MTIRLVRLNLAAILSLLPLAFAAATLPSETNAQVRRTGMLEGRVTDKETGQPIPGANVILAGTSYGAAADTMGRYIIRNLPPGDYAIGVSVIGYKRAEARVVVSIWQTTIQDFALEVEPIPIGQVEAQAPRAELEKEVQISVQELRGAELQIAGAAAQADLFRTIQTLPAVAQASDFSSELYIRGGSPDQNLVLLDGATVYNPFHFIGFFGAFNSLGVESAELHAGGYPARYGGRASSVLDIRNKVGDRNNYHGQFDLNLLSANGLIEGPIPGGSFCLSGRRSFQKYLDVLNKSGVYGSHVPPYRFYDLQGKIVTNLTPAHRLVLSGYWADDHMRDYEEKVQGPNMSIHDDQQLYRNIIDMLWSLKIPDFFNVDKYLYTYSHAISGNQPYFRLDSDWGNRAGSAAWQYLPSDNFSNSLTFAASRFYSNFDIIDNTIYPMYVFCDERIDDRSLMDDITWSLNDRAQIRAGVSWKDLRVNYLLMSPEESLEPKLFPSAKDYVQLKVERPSSELSSYVEGSVDLSANLLANAGLRFNRYQVFTGGAPDVYSTNFLKYSHEARFFRPKTESNIEPRLGLRYTINEDNFLKLGWGIYHQNLFLIPLRSDSNINVLNLWFPLDGKYSPLRAVHYIVGYKRYLSAGLSVSAELYYKRLDNFLEQADTYVYTDPNGFFNKTEVGVKGLELTLRLQGRDTYGWLGYSLSQASTASGADRYDLWFDQRHRINFVLHWFSYDRKWESSLSWTYNSGLPYTKIIADALTLDLQGDNEPDGIIGYNYLPVNVNGIKHAWRYSAYHRMDLSLKRVLLTEPFDLSACVWWVNLYNHRNVFFYRYQGAYTYPGKISMLPSFPFIGLEGRF